MTRGRSARRKPTHPAKPHPTPLLAALRQPSHHGASPAPSETARSDWLLFRPPTPIGHPHFPVLFPSGKGERGSDWLRGVAGWWTVRCCRCGALRCAEYRWPPVRPSARPLPSFPQLSPRTVHSSPERLAPLCPTTPRHLRSPSGPAAAMSKPPPKPAKPGKGGSLRLGPPPSPVLAVSAGPPWARAARCRLTRGRRGSGARAVRTGGSRLSPSRRH